jgi:hypothetical protein
LKNGSDGELVAGTGVEERLTHALWSRREVSKWGAESERSRQWTVVWEISQLLGAIIPRRTVVDQCSGV